MPKIKSAAKSGKDKKAKPSVELAIKKELPVIIDEAIALTIDSPEALTVGTDLLSRLNITLKKIDTEREKVTKPLNEALKAENGRWKPAKDAITGAVGELRDKMSKYQTEQINEQRAVENAQAERLEKGEIDIEKAVENASVFKAVDKVTTDAGSLSFKPKPQLKVTDPMAVPREYLMIDEDKLFAALQAGREVPGAEIEIIQVPVNRR
jgi:hypothetical protein